MVMRVAPSANRSLTACRPTAYRQVRVITLIKPLIEPRSSRLLEFWRNVPVPVQGGGHS